MNKLKTLNISETNTYLRKTEREKRTEPYIWEPKP